MNRNSRSNALVILVLLITVFSLGGFMSSTIKLEENKLQIDSLTKISNDLEHTIDSLKAVNDSLNSLSVTDIVTAEQFIRWNNFSYPKLMLAVIKEESGHMSSNLTFTNNNIIGMKFPGKRPTTALYKKNGYSYYESYEKSIEDLNIYFELYIKPRGLNRSQAAYFLEKNYGMVDGYAKRLLALI